jgi:hypothetical protein
MKLCTIEARALVDWVEVSSVYATVQENESLYSAEQVCRAK